MERVLIDNILCLRFVSGSVKTNMYLMVDGSEALIIDPHPNNEMMALLKKQNVKHITVFLTHEHPDHTCGIPGLKKSFSVTLICQEKCAEAVAVQRNNRPLLMAMVLAAQDRKNGTETMRDFLKNFPVYECHADLTFDRTFQYDAAGQHFEFTAAPGHSPGGCFICMNNKAVFTGDNWIPDTPVITNFPGGDPEAYRTETRPYLDALPPGTQILPGHGECFLK